MRRLKADLHTHTAEDPRDGLDYSAEMLIEAAAQLNVGVLAITCHEALVHSARLVEFAERRGILLVPGVELCIENKHVVILNPDEEQASARTFSELRAMGRRDAALIAPHPFYPTFHSLGRDLVRNIDLFDAIELCSLYCRGADFNRRARRVARRFQMPMVGTSDIHGLPYRDSTFSWIEAEPTVAGVVGALREGRVSVDSRPRSLIQAGVGAVSAFRGIMKH
jgi:predicted metal-dependent phosphoesterase TrpH